MRSSSSAETEKLGESIGSRLQGGEVIELVSDLGGGKTTFTRGLARGAGSANSVGSPTFTLSREYHAPDFTIVHFDFYRLGEAGILGDELSEIIDDDTKVVVVEWGDIVQDVLPDSRMTVEIVSDAEDENSRQISIYYFDDLSYLIPDRSER